MCASGKKKKKKKYNIQTSHNHVHFHLIMASVPSTPELYAWYNGSGNVQMNTVVTQIREACARLYGPADDTPAVRAYRVVALLRFVGSGHAGTVAGILGVDPDTIDCSMLDERCVIRGIGDFYTHLNSDFYTENEDSIELHTALIECFETCLRDVYETIDSLRVTTITIPKSIIPYISNSTGDQHISVVAPHGHPIT